MNGGYLLDTNILIAFFRADLVVRDKVNSTEQVYVPIVAIAELYYGVMASHSVAKNVERVDNLIAGAAVVECDLSTAREYGTIKQELRSAGTPIPDNDIWIAAVARQHGLILVSRDAHFAAITGLTVEGW